MIGKLGLAALRAALGIILVVSLYAGGHPAAAQQSGLQIVSGKLLIQANPNLDSRLNQLSSAAASPGQLAPFAQQQGISLAGGMVRVIAVAVPGQTQAASEAASRLGTVETTYEDLVQVLVPASQLSRLAESASVRFVRMPYEAMPDAVTTEGVAITGANSWQGAGINGAGVKVAVLDVGFSGYATRQTAGDLPASITTWWAPSIGGSGTSIHGTACAEIVYDMAPGAQLYLANFGTEAELGNAVSWLVTQGVKVISASWGYPSGGPGDGTGPICQIVDTARNAGVLWVNAAGNSARSHWQGNFADPDGDALHNFSGTDETNAISALAGSRISVDLKWNDVWGSSVNDYDLYLFDSTLTIPVASSENIQNGTGNPVESLNYVAPSAGTYYAVVTKYAGAVKYLHLYSYNLDFGYYVVSGSLTVPADSINALAVGAVFWNSPATLESFSSQGPTSDGRFKPDMVSPDGVTTGTYGAGGFYGTSAAAPHTAGAAALVKQMFPAYTPAQLQSFLESRAVDLGAAGKDNLYGSGRLSLGTLPPTVATAPATNLAFNAARLNANFTSKGTAVSANVSFEWGTTAGTWPNATSTQTLSAPGTYLFDLGSLLPNTTYYYRAKAVGNGTGYGNEVSFLTLPTTPPIVTTDNASGLTLTSAVLGGTLASRGTAPSANVSFEWGLTTSYGNDTTIQIAAPTGAFTATVTGLTPSTTYHFRAKAVGHGVAYGSDKTFGTPATTPPSVSTMPSGVTPTMAILNGDLTSLGSGASANVSFEWGTSAGSYSHTTAPQSMGATGPFSANVSGLSLLTTYYFRAKAVGQGTGHGTERSFTFYGITPSVTTDNPTLVSNFSVQLNGTVSSFGSYVSANVSFAWGVAGTGMTNLTPVQAVSPPGTYQFQLTGLSANTTYEYVAVPVGYGGFFGVNIKTFSTPPLVPPSLTTDTPTSITPGSAMVRGTLTGLGTVSSCNVSFAWGTAPGNMPFTTVMEAASAPGSFSANLTGLAPATTYYYRAKAVGHGTTLGAERSFTTLAGTPPSVITDNDTNRSYFSARVSGNITSFGTYTSANVSFRWGTDVANLVNETTSQTLQTPGPFYYDLTVPSANTTFYYQAKAVGHGTSYGTVKSFVTLPTTPPSVVTVNAAGIVSSSATLSGNLTSLGTASPVGVSFRWGLTPSSLNSETGPQSLTAAGMFSSILLGLSPNSTYYFQAKAQGGLHGLGLGDVKSFTSPPSPPPSGGGGFSGGGGGGGPAPTGPGVTGLSPYTNDEGLFNLGTTAKSDDGKASLSIAAGVRAKAKDGTGLKSITLVPMTSPPGAPTGSVMIGLVYEMTPDGATFSPSVGLTLFYDPAKLPADIDIDSLTIAVLNIQQLRWDALQSIHNKTDKSLTTMVDHFSNYAIIGKTKVVAPPPPPPAPASFALSELTVSPAASLPGQPVSVSAKVSNNGGTSGEYEIILKVNGTLDATRKVTVGPSSSSVVTFAVTRSAAGSYAIDVNGSTASFTVAVPEPTPTSLPQQVTPVPSVEQPRSSNTLWLVIGLVVGVALIGWAAFALIRARRRPAS
jgi:hypothetical protein